MTLRIVNNGIFPISYDENNVFLCDINPTYSNIPGAIISEGQLVGHRCIYIKVCGCNLRCAWNTYTGSGSLCDSYLDSYWNNGIDVEIKTIAKIIKNNTHNIKNVYITGGEPLLQFNELTELIRYLHKLKLNVILETNGTLYDEFICNNVDYLILSPKLSTSIPWEANLKNTDIEYYEAYALKHNFLRKNIRFLTYYLTNRKKLNKLTELKFVISKSTDISEIYFDYLRYFNDIIDSSQITLVPEGTNYTDLKETSKIAMYEAVKNNWFFSPRLQYML